MTQGKFIVLEGIEGSGKSYACNYIKKILRNHGIKNILSVREPGSTPIAEKIRNLIIKNIKNEKITSNTELLLIYAARVQLLETIIQPELKKGTWIIGDRHEMSSLAYQGGGGGIEKSILNTLKKIFLKDFSPNLTIFLDVCPKLGMYRVNLRGKPDRIEQKSLNFFIRTRNTYLKIINSHSNIIKINANLDLELVKKSIKLKFNHWLKENNI